MSRRHGHATRPAGAGAAVAVAAGVLGAGLLAVGAGPAAAADQCQAGVTQYVDSMPPALQRLNAAAAWQVASGDGVVVAVVDSGVDAQNAHFKGALVKGKSLVPGLRATQDATSHGTAIAGEIAARTVATSGVVGLAYAAKIMPVRVFYSSSESDRAAGVGPRADRIAAGIRYAADHGAKVINVSMSTPSPDARLSSAVEHATAKGALVVASAGNRTQSDDKKDSPRYPAAYPQVEAVAATDSSDTVTEDSVHGPHVDIAAPGDDILTTFFAAGDCLLSQEEESTSFATAYVSATAALLAQRYPKEGPAGWKHRMEVSAARVQADRRDDRAGWGLLQPYEALTVVDDGTLAGPPRARSRPSVLSVPRSQPLDLRHSVDPGEPGRTAALWWTLGGSSAVVALGLAGLLRPGRRSAPRAPAPVHQSPPAPAGPDQAVAARPSEVAGRR